MKFDELLISALESRAHEMRKHRNINVDTDSYVDEMLYLIVQKLINEVELDEYK